MDLRPCACRAALAATGRPRAHAFPRHYYAPGWAAGPGDLTEPTRCWPAPRALSWMTHGGTFAFYRPDGTDIDDW